jgi:hypothetical protein
VGVTIQKTGFPVSRIRKRLVSPGRCLESRTALCNVILTMTPWPSMLPLNTYSIQCWVISRSTHDRDSTSAISSPTDKLIVIILIEILLNQKKQRVRIVRQDGDSGVEDVVKV